MNNSQVEFSKKKQARQNPTLRCGANLRKKPGQTCSHWAGFRTDHPGQGRCWLHGGLTKKGKKMLQTQKEERERLRQLRSLTVEELAERFIRDQDLINLDRDIGIAEAMLAKLDKSQLENYPAAARLLDVIVKSKKAKWEIEKERMYALPISNVREIITRLFALIGIHVTDRLIKEKLFSAFEETLQEMKFQIPARTEESKK